ncbi:MAG: VOC family protein [Pseudomonadota bacterium]
MINLVGIDHIVLRADDYQGLIDFYCRVLGAQVERALEDLGLTQLRAGNALIDIVDVHGELGRSGGPAPSTQGNNLDHFCLQIEPFDEAALQGYLREHGIETGEFAERYGAQGMGRSLYIHDTEGNVVELRAVQRQ